jgi:hypothetical protein
VTITYKPYEQHQSYLIPPSAEELIPKDHLVRLVNEVVDENADGERVHKTGILFCGTYIILKMMIFIVFL